jgi:MFS family permease
VALESLKVLKARNYALLWWSGLISNAGTWMQSVAIGTLVTSLTHKASWGASIAAVSYLASGIFTPFGGVIADRHDRRRLLITASVAEAAVASLLAVMYVSGHISPAVLLVNVALEGALLGFYQPASSAMLPDLVGKDHLAEAAALGNASWNLGRTVGPALGGAVIAYSSYGAVFIINAISCLIVAIAMCSVRIKPTVHDTLGSTWHRLRDGLQGARANKGCWYAIKTIPLVAILVSPFIALMPAMGQLVLHGTAIDTSHLVIAQGVGSVVGAIALAPLARRFGRRRMIMTSLISAPVVEMLYSQAPTKLLADIGAFLMGCTYVGILVGLSVVIQLHAPARLRARVLSLNFTTLALFYPLGSLLQGWVGDQVGVRTVLFVGPLSFLACLGAIALFSPQWLRSLDGPGPAVKTPSKPATELA